MLTAVTAAGLAAVLEDRATIPADAAADVTVTVPVAVELPPALLAVNRTEYVPAAA
jgi:hypothetical protein